VRVAGYGACVHGDERLAGSAARPSGSTVAHGERVFILERGQGYDRGVSEMSSGPPPIRVPRWIQLVGLPVLLLLIFLLARPLGHVLFLFLTASVIAFTLNPLVRDLQRLKLPRGLSVAVVAVIFATAFIGLLVALGTVVVSETRSAADRIDTYLTEESSLTGQTGVEVDVDRLQAWLDDHGLEGIRIEEQLDDMTESIGAGDVSGYVQDAISFAQGAALSVILFLFSAVLVVVISIYMLLDMPRLERSIDRRFPPHGGLPLTQRIERALWGYVKGQAILSIVIGTSAGVGMWILGTTGLVEGAEEYALLFGLWTAFIEVIPYIGPWLSAVPPAIYALVVDPVGVLWVAALFVFIYQVEGHVVVPNVMASALRLHPLLVIFGLLAGGALYGIPGVLVALPTMAAGRAIWEFFGERIDFESWDDVRGGAAPVEVELEPPRADEPPRAASGAP
jgi:predicted PurR-regulated permease PerM